MAADEAVVRIIVQGEGGGGSPAASVSTPEPPPEPGVPRQPSAGQSPSAFDPQEALARRKRRRQKKYEVDSLEAEHYQGSPEPTVRKRREDRFAGPPMSEDVAEEYAVKQLYEKRKERNSRLEKVRKLEDADAKAATPSPLPPEVVREEAIKDLYEKRKEQREILAGVHKLEDADAKAAFDPAQEARSQRAKEDRQLQVRAQYDKMYGGADRPDPSMELIKKLRGSIGGLGGPLVGAVLDLLANSQKKGNRAGTGATGGGGNEPPQSIEAYDIASKFNQGNGAGVKGAPGRNFIPADFAANNPPPTGGAGAEIAAGGGAAAAAGPLLIAMAVKMAIEAVTKGIKATVSGAAGVANFAADPSADPAVPIKNAGEAVSQFGDKITSLNPVMGWFATAAGESAKALSGLMQALDKTADRYGEYSPQIAQAQAIAEIKQTMGDFKRAQTLGSEMAKYVAAQADLQQKFEDVKVKILVKILPLVVKIVEGLEKVMPVGDVIANAIGAATDPIRAISDAINYYTKTKQDEKLDQFTDPTEQILNDVNFNGHGNWVPKL